MNNTYCVYIHICPNDKKYVGITKKNINERWKYGHGYKDCTLFQKAIDKYGWKNIEHKVLYQNLSKDVAEEIEIKMISELKLLDRNYGYNLKPGGRTSPLTEEIKLKISKSAKGKIISKEQIEKRRKTMELNGIPNRPTDYAVKKSALLRRKNISMLNQNGVFISNFESLTQAVLFTGIAKTNISACLHGKRKSAGGYIWKLNTKGNIYDF